MSLKEIKFNPETTYEKIRSAKAKEHLRNLADFFDEAKPKFNRGYDAFADGKLNKENVILMDEPINVIKKEPVTIEQELTNPAIRFNHPYFAMYPVDRVSVDENLDFGQHIPQQPAFTYITVNDSSVVITIYKDIIAGQYVYSVSTHQPQPKKRGVPLKKDYFSIYQEEPKFYVVEGRKFKKQLNKTMLSALKRYGYTKFIQLNPDFRYKEVDPIPVNEDEEIIVNLLELATHYALEELRKDNPTFSATDNVSLYTECVNKHITTIQSFKRNNDE